MDRIKTTVAVSLGAIISLVSMAAVLGATFPTKAEVSHKIATESPYVQDRKLILYRLDEIQDSLDTLLERE
jgi:hypothetical protein